MSKKRRNLVNDKKYHYTYRITNIKERMYYYGVHSCDCLPKEDIGVKYWSTSKRDGFIEHQKQNPEQYKYKIIKIFSTRVEAVEHEMFLHKKFDVKLHEKFYNNSNQTSTGFDTTGMTTVFDIIDKKYKSLPIDLIDPNIHKYSNSGKIRVFNTISRSNEYIFVDSLDSDMHSKSIIPIVCRCYDKNNDIILVESSIYQQNKHLYTHHLTNTVTALNLITGKNIKISKEEFENNNNLVGVTSGSKYKRSNEYIEKFKGSNNGRALKINIIDSNNDIIYECNGNFKEVCVENNLPYKQLYKSYKNNKFVYCSNRKSAITQIIKLYGIDYYEKYKMWRAVRL